MQQRTEDLNPAPIVLAVLAGFFFLIVATSAVGKFTVTHTPLGAPVAAPAAAPAKAPAAAPTATP